MAADLNDESVLPLPAWTIYHPLRQIPFGGRLFVQTAGGDPYALVPAISRVIREISAEQPVERAATLEDVRAALLTPDRVNAFVVAGFAGVALAIAIVGVAGVLAFLRQRAHARVRRAAGGGLDAARSADARCCAKAPASWRWASSPAWASATGWPPWARATWTA